MATSPRNRIDTGLWAPRILSVLRIVLALLFIEHGLIKLIGFPAGAAPGQVPIASIYGVAAILELVGGIGLLLGLFTRPIAFILSGEMAVAYFMAHFPQNFFPAINQGEPAILFCFTALYLAFAGAGPWSIDARRAGKV